MPLARRSAKEHFCFEKSCKFIGSLAVSLLKGEERQAYVNEKLLEMRESGKGISVVLQVTEEGVKIFKSDKSAIKMAHGITRVAFSTCHPDRKLFAYVSKGKGVNGEIVTQAHMFKTKKGQHTQELSSSISRAFKISYSRNTMKRQKHVDLWEKNAEESKEKINAEKKRWAKNDLAHGHDNSAHALRAKGIGSASRSIQRLVEDLDKEAGLETAISKEEYAITENIPKERDHTKFNREKILNDNDTNIEKKRRVSATRRKKFSTENRFDVASDLQNNIEVDVNDNIDNLAKLESESTSSQSGSNMQKLDDLEEERKVSRDSTSLDDWGVIRLSMADIPGPPGEFVIPAPKFGTFSEDLKESHEEFGSASKPSNTKFVKPATKFGTLPENDYILNVVDEEVFYQNADSMKGNNTNDNRTSKMMTLSENQILKNSEWFQPGFSRAIAEEVLQNRSVGSFFIRDSSSHTGSYVMTMKVPKDIKESQTLNYLIVKNSAELFRIKGFSSVFPGLTSLVEHYSSAQNDIPVSLHLSSDNPLFNMMNEEGVNNQVDGCELDYLLDTEDEDGEDADYINFSCSADLMKDLDELCFN